MDDQGLPDILKPLHKWSCETCGIRMVFRREDDLETNKRDHLDSEWHAQNAED
jgi:hypothetical protein